MKTKTILAMVAAISGAWLGGCGMHSQTTVYEVQPAYEQPQPTYVAAPEVVVLHREPPPILVEEIAPRPGPTYVWVNGYWAAHGAQWVWVRGAWALPPQAGAVWVEPQYEHHGHDVHFSPGHWKHGEVVMAAPIAPVGARPKVLVVHRTPPPLVVERVPARPAAGYVWVKGYWQAKGDEWAWVKGVWVAPPRENAVWVEPRYEDHGTEIQFSMGYWK